MYTYEQTQHFFSGPTEVGQSELLLHFINRVYQASGKQDLSLQLLLASFEMANILVQLAIFYKAYAITQKKENDTNTALFFIMFNPISLLGGFNNLASFNDFLWHLMILAPLTEMLSLRLVLAVLAVIVTYFNPGAIFCLIPLIVLQARLGVPEEPHKHDTIRRMILFAGLLDLMYLACSTQ